MTALETMRRWFETLDVELLHEDIVWLAPGYPVPQDAYRGRDAVVNDFFPALNAHFSEWSAEPEEMIEAADGEHVTVRGSYIGKTLDGELLNVPFLHLWKVSDGKIVQALAVANTAIFSAALD